MKRDHMEVLITLREAGLISRDAMKTIRGQILGMKTDAEREQYLRRVIANSGKRQRND